MTTTGLTVLLPTRPAQKEQTSSANRMAIVRQEKSRPSPTKAAGNFRIVIVSSRLATACYLIRHPGRCVSDSCIYIRPLSASVIDGNAYLRILHSRE
ncbi:hypothetical protein AVEN_59677-1 [Araneus ventricosus]|uniref:Uncharacterized protein n=1 Tax=Araneus ventricosus TaxID=182803 RepID=A0A4Y2BP61_ARAVE|nr:hypothetical protein AVEN_59677-1 [Araneus ventricosus]